MTNCEDLTNDASCAKPCVPQAANDLPDIPLVAISGYPGTGKTILIEKLVAELKGRGYQVATIKHTHHTLGDPGKDTERHLGSGATASLLVADERMVLAKPTTHPPSIKEMTRLLRNDYDLIICEGFKDSNLPKIALVRNAEELHGMSCVIGIIADTPLSQNAPCFSRDNIIPIADLLEQEYILPQSGRISVFVNGEPIPLLPFPKAAITRSITGLLSALKGVENIQHLEITIAHPKQITKP